MIEILEVFYWKGLLKEEVLKVQLALRHNNLKTRTAMNAKISVFVFCIEAIIYLLLYNLHDCTFKNILQSFKAFRRREINSFDLRVLILT